MTNYKYGVFCNGCAVPLSYHKTVESAIERIELYEEIDQREGVYNEYEWKALEEDI